MSVIVKLRTSDFWNKKFQRAMEVRDIDRNGFIERSDFQKMEQRYRDLPGVSEKKIKALAETITGMCDRVGLTGDTQKMSYEAFKEKWLSAKSQLEKEGKLHTVGPKMFDVIDINENGAITLDEWTLHYKCYGIDTAHAPASFEAIDTNRNGKITRDEFAAYYDEFFHSADDKLNSSILYGPLA